VEPITNLYLTADEYALLKRLPGDELVKRRHAFRTGSVPCVLDVFGGALAGRMIAEVEAGDLAALWAIRPPDWFGREITGEPAYAGAALARFGWPSDAIP
jgi:adenylate cyclase